MKLIPKVNLKALSPSQVRAWVAGSLGSATIVLTALISLLRALGAVPGLHLPVWVTVLVSVLGFLVSQAGIIVPMFSRSLSKANSGNGEGIVGNPKPEDVLAGQAVAAEVAGAMNTATTYLASPAVASVVAMLESGLSQQSKFKWQALGLSLLAAEHENSALSQTQPMTQASLAAGHAEIAAIAGGSPS